MLQEAVDDFLASLAGGEVERSGGSLNTMMAYRNDLGQLCTYILSQGSHDWWQVTHEQLATYMDKMRMGQGYRPATMARKLATMKAFFRYLRHKGAVSVDPTTDVILPPIERDQPQILSSEQIHTLFNCVDRDTPLGLRDLAMLHLLYATGIRTSELISLDVTHFQAQETLVNCVNVRGHVKRNRVLPLTAVAADALERYLTNGRPLLQPATGQQAIFLNHRGERLTRQGFWLVIKGHAQRAEIEELSPHMLRHSFAMLMLDSGMELSSVQELLGHAHISTTQLYCHITPGLNK